MTRDQAARAALERLEAPIGRLRKSLSQNPGLFPLTTSVGPTVDDTALDAFLQRFQQVFDLLARKVMPTAYSALQAEPRALPFRDLLDGLERLGLIDDADWWEERNELRNLLIHDYAMTDQVRAEKLNQAWETAPALIDQAERLNAALIARNI